MLGACRMPSCPLRFRDPVTIRLQADAHGVGGGFAASINDQHVAWGEMDCSCALREIMH